MRTRSLFRMNRLTPVVLFMALVASLVQVRPAYAASILVNTDADNYANDGKCTLREAIDAANLNVRSGPAAGECAAGSAAGIDTITFAGNYIITVGSGGTALPQLPFVISPITITGRGAGNTIIQAAASPDTATWRLFQVTPMGNLTLDGVTVRHGRCNGACTVVGNIEPDAGGGIYNSGILTVTNSIISENTGTFGGGIYNNAGTVTVTNSTISNNNSSQATTGVGGGGIHNSGNLTITGSIISGNQAVGGGGIENIGTLTVTDSTFSGNSAIGEFGIGGALYNDNEDTLIVTNSTFIGNTATYLGGAFFNNWRANITGTTFVGNSVLGNGQDPGDGGGIYSNGLIRLTNSTVTANTALTGTGGGIYSFNSNLFVTNSTIAGNNASAADGAYVGGTGAIFHNTIVANNNGPNCGGATIPNGGNNLDSGSTCGFGFNNGSKSNTNPLLGSLADNGGLTQTMKLLPGSPAIDAGDPSICSASPVNGRDQRGVLRPLGGGCDIGAFETSHHPGPDTVGVFRPSNGFLFLKHINLTGFADLALNYGLGGDYPVVGDWDSNGTDTIGVYRNGTFFLRNSNSLGIHDIKFDFGQAGDQPVAGDWNGDGIDTIGLYRPSTGQFFLRNTNSTGVPDVTFFLGNPGDVGLAGDWNGDGIDTTGVFRPSNGFIFLKNSNSTGFADLALNYGLAGDKPVTGDWNRDGIDTIGVLRGNIFLLRNLNTNGYHDMSFALGNPGDMPIAGNWDGVP